MLKSKGIIAITVIAVFMSLIACGGEDVDENVYLPKPLAYPRITLLSNEYRTLDSTQPYTIEVSKHAKIQESKSYYKEPHWIDLYYPYYDCSLQLTYKDLTLDTNNIDKLIDETYILANKHNTKAYSIEQFNVKAPNGRISVVYELAGDIPSQFQFFATDSTKHFVRGALYFNEATKNDSLAPIIEYMKTETIQLLNTLEWKK